MQKDWDKLVKRGCVYTKLEMHVCVCSWLIENVASQNETLYAPFTSTEHDMNVVFTVIAAQQSINMSVAHATCQLSVFGSVHVECGGVAGTWNWQSGSFRIARAAEPAKKVHSGEYSCNVRIGVNSGLHSF